MPRSSQLQFVPLGGLGEFGMNLMLYRWGDDCIVVDAGVMFPGEEHLGVDVVVPDLAFLDDCGTLHGVVLTHGHEDHIGALPYLLARHDLPVYGTPYTLGLVRRRLVQHGISDPAALRPLDDAPLRLGPFTIEPIPVAHSIPQSRMFVVRTPLGTIVHTADFKLDQDPLGGACVDLERLATLGRHGVLALLSDSTNADRPGTTPGEASIETGLDEQIARARGRVVVTTFASHMHRVQLLARLAGRHDRKIALVGASMRGHADVAEELGLLPLPAGTRIAPESIGDYAPHELLIVASGSQGEPGSAMARIAVGRHRHVEIGDGDLVLHSAREIPGCGKNIARMINHLMRRGAEVVTAARAPIHVSGHAAADELRRVIELLRPRFVVPIHGEYRQLSAHARLAADCGIEASRVLLADSGDVIEVTASEIAIVDHVRAGQVFIDATRDEVDLAVLQDRRRIADDGIVVPVVAVHRETGVVNGSPEIVTRGFVPIRDEGDDTLLEEARRVLIASLDDATPEERGDEALLRARIQGELRRFLRRRTNRRPLVVPVILEL